MCTLESTYVKSIFSLNYNCVVCQEPIHNEGIRVPCGHHYDIECIASLFLATTRDESLFPPRCCRQLIPLSIVRTYFPPLLLKEFAEKSREFSTIRRVYCANHRCSQFLGPQTDGTRWLMRGPKVYPCKCGTATCSKCKTVYYNAVKHSCSYKIDGETEYVLSLGKTEGWARCPGCRAMIELNMGCNHMTCLCKVGLSYHPQSSLMCFH
jgi:hypothetical protein